MSQTTPADWPYPRWVAHRGAGKLAPENTLAAFRLGAAHGWRMFECDVKLSADGVPFLLHDATLERTTNGNGTAGALTWPTLETLDAGSWHSPTYHGEPLPTLEAVASFCLDHGYALNIEIKPTPGQEDETGRVVAQHAERLWRLRGAGTEAGIPWPLMTSFSPEALAAAREAAPVLPRGLLLQEWWPGWDQAAKERECVAIVAHHPIWTADAVQQVHANGWRALSYTVNDEETAQRLWAMGLDGLITDAVDRFKPQA